MFFVCGDGLSKVNLVLTRIAKKNQYSTMILKTSFKKLLYGKEKYTWELLLKKKSDIELHLWFRSRLQKIITDYKQMYEFCTVIAGVGFGNFINVFNASEGCFHETLA